mmetsp:Transcript_48871/g.136827  ORF Transcript_48871/g.136827 Transcript_48871/m.136827 type:complete len:203 (+) Transcript_48871:1196-1804(+)
MMHVWPSSQRRLSEPLPWSAARQRPKSANCPAGVSISIGLSLCRAMRSSAAAPHSCMGLSSSIPHTAKVFGCLQFGYSFISTSNTFVTSMWSRPMGGGFDAVRRVPAETPMPVKMMITQKTMRILPPMPLNELNKGPVQNFSNALGSGSSPGTFGFDILDQSVPPLVNTALQQPQQHPGPRHFPGAGAFIPQTRQQQEKPLK